MQSTNVLGPVEETVVCCRAVRVGMAKSADADAIPGMLFDQAQGGAPDRQSKRQCVIERGGIALQCGGRAVDALGEARRELPHRQSTGQTQDSCHTHTNECSPTAAEFAPQQCDQDQTVNQPRGARTRQQYHPQAEECCPKQPFASTKIARLPQQQGRQSCQHAAQLQIVIAEDAAEPVGQIAAAETEAGTGLQQRVQQPHRQHGGAAAQNTPQGWCAPQLRVCEQQERQKAQVGKHLRPGLHRLDGIRRGHQFGQPIGEKGHEQRARVRVKLQSWQLAQAQQRGKQHGQFGRSSPRHQYERHQ